MRYRLIAISVVAVALAAATLVFALNRSSESSPQRSQPELFPEGVGLVSAFTATAEAGGAALDPTALATPTSTSVPSEPSPAPNRDDSPSASPTGAPSHLVEVSSAEASPGERITVEISDAILEETFEISIDGNPVETSSLSVDSLGNLTIDIVVPDGVSGDSLELVVAGSESGTSSTSVNISTTEPQVVVSPEEPVSGESVTVSVEGFEPGEAVTVSVAGQEIGNGITGQDGSFSITTGLPELAAPGGTRQSLNVNGSGGSQASTEFRTPQRSDSPGPAPVIAQPTASSVSSEQQSPVQQSTDETGSKAETVPAWLYAAVGVIAGWLAALTIWVFQMDRDRGKQVKFLKQVIADLVLSKKLDREASSDSETSDADNEDQAA